MTAKWFAICATVVFASMFAAIGVEAYQKGQCKQSFAWTGKSAEDIVKICGK